MWSLVFASNSGHFRINDFLLFFTPLLLLSYFLFNLFLFLQKSEGAKAPPAPPCAQSLMYQIGGNSQVEEHYKVYEEGYKENH